MRAIDGPPMWWQQHVLDVACEIDPATGLYWYRNVVLLVPRQAGKTSVSRSKVTHRCITTQKAPVLYTAQDRNKSLRRLQKSFYDRLSSSPLSPVLDRPRWSNGSEAVRFINGSEIFIDAPTKKQSGHGETIPEAHIDEAFAHPDGRIDQAVGPALIVTQGSQKWVTSAAGDSSSVYLWGKVEAGRALIEAGTKSRTAYFEWSAPDDADRFDPATVLNTHPAVGYTITVDDLFAEQESMDSSGPEEWDRAYISRWPRASERPWVIPKQAWRDCAADPETVTWDGAPIWSVDIAPDRDMAAIGFAATTDSGHPWLEVAAHDYGEGWVLPHLEKLRSQFGGEMVVLDGAGPAAALEPELEEAGFAVRRLTQRQKVDACGALYRSAQQGTLLHGNDPRMDAALQSAAKRKSGDAWVWGRGISSDDITPLYSLTMARFVWVEEHANDYDLLDSVR